MLKVCATAASVVRSVAIPHSHLRPRFRRQQVRKLCTSTPIYVSCFATAASTTEPESTSSRTGQACLHVSVLQGVAHSMAVAAMLAAFALQPPASIAGLQEAGALEAESSMEVLRGPSPDIPTEFPPLPDIVMPDIEEVVLSNGLRVFFLEDHELPVVRGTLAMRGGQRASPQEKLGVATMSIAVQRSGGSEAHPSDSMDEELEQRAAYIEGGAGMEASTMGFECLKEDADDVIRLLSEIILTPALPQQKIEIVRAQVSNIIEHRNDSAGGIPRRELGTLLYGKDSVFARRPTLAQVQSVAREDIQDYLATWQRPDAAILGIVGDFNKGELKDTVEKYFGRWSPAEGQPPEPLDIPNSAVPDTSDIAGAVFLYDRPGLTQSTVVMGQMGVKMGDPDLFPLEVLNDILNSFGGRLFDQIRSREGLVYSISGGWDTSSMDHEGLFVARGDTASPALLIPLLRDALQEAREFAPTEKEVQESKERTTNSFVFNFASLSAQLQRRVAYALLGIPEDYLFQYKAGIEKVTPDAVLEAAQRHLNPDKLVTVIAADAEKVQASLEGLGQTILPLTVDD